MIAARRQCAESAASRRTVADLFSSAVGCQASKGLPRRVGEAPRVERCDGQGGRSLRRGARATMGDGGVKEGEREQQGIGGGADGAHSAEARSGRSGRRGSDIQRQRPRSSPSFPWCPRYQPPHSLRAGFESHSSSTTALQVSASHPPIATPTKTSSPLNTPRNPNPSLHRSSSSLRRSHARPGPLGASPISRHSASSLPHPNSARLPSFVLLPHRPGKQPPPTYHLTDSSSPPPISTSQP